jgi:hypothetical protein
LAETVEKGVDLPGAIQRALHAIQTEQRQALSMSTSHTRRGTDRQQCDWPARKMSGEEGDRQGGQCLTRCQCPTNGCRRRQTASARPSLPLSAAPEPQRSAYEVQTSHA